VSGPYAGLRPGRARTRSSSTSWATASPRPAGAIAADTAAVLSDVLGLDDAAVAALHDDGVVHGGTQ
jgi:hypothetical protein